MNSYQYPRKFSITPITEFGTANAAANTTDATASLARCPTNCSCTSPTDEQEYWACTGTVFDDPIDTGTYKNLALTEPEAGIIVPSCITSGGAADGTPVQWATSGGYFDVNQCNSGNTDRVLFDGAYTVPNPNTVIYVDNGDAQFNSVEMDFGGAVNAKGAFIAAANLFVNGTIPITAAPNQTLGIRQPPNYLQEYPYGKSGLLPTPICPSVGCSCAAVANSPPCTLPFRGFLYVLGNMTVQTGGAASNFVMSGVLRVDGLVTGVPTGPGLTVNDGNSLVVYYDDVINHNIRTGSSTTTTPQPVFELQIDSTTAINL
jgi:hypothetical protein